MAVLVYCWYVPLVEGEAWHAGIWQMEGRGGPAALPSFFPLPAACPSVAAAHPAAARGPGRVGEERLRRSGVPYTVVRPGGLVNEPAGQAQLVVAQVRAGMNGTVVCVRVQVAMGGSGDMGL